MLLSSVVVPCDVLSGVSEDTDAFHEVKSGHFIVKFTLPEEKAFSSKVLDRAEECYDRISRDIGYSRYQNYWTWEQRVKIVLFPDRYAFTRFTGQPKWSKGYASRDSRLFRDRVIVSFSGQSDFFEEILPHEISHLMLWDYLGFNNRKVPVWFEEGVAQLQEADKREVVKEALRPVVADKSYIPFREFNEFTVTGLDDDAKVVVFYAQSLSVVIFLAEKYGQDAFYRLIKELRNGGGFEPALFRSYTGIYDSMAALEDKWAQYILCQ